MLWRQFFSYQHLEGLSSAFHSQVLIPRNWFCRCRCFGRQVFFCLYGYATLQAWVFEKSIVFQPLCKAIFIINMPQCPCVRGSLGLSSPCWSLWNVDHFHPVAAWWDLIFGKTNHVTVFFKRVVAICKSVFILHPLIVFTRKKGHGWDCHWDFFET